LLTLDASIPPSEAHGQVERGMAQLAGNIRCMADSDLATSLQKISDALVEQPEKAIVKNAPATALLQEGLKCVVTGPTGECVHTDMPRGVGGTAAAPNPGWFLRAALAACNATVVAMRAAQRGVELSRLEVTVSSETDARGMLGIDEAISAGMRDLRCEVKIAARGGATPEELREIVYWAVAHSPVGCTALASTGLDIEIVAG
jgi:uncharacterized OsmC-like protein